MEDRTVHWVGEVKECDLCHKPIRLTFIDGRTRAGKWAIADLKCARIHGITLGLGRGQMFRKQPDGRWLKIEG